MSDETTTESMAATAAPAPKLASPRWLAVTRMLGADVVVALVIVVAIVTILLFSSGASTFIYVGF
jgi:hypothetical protein